MHEPEMTPRPSVFVSSTAFASQKLGVKEVDDARAGKSQEDIGLLWVICGPSGAADLVRSTLNSGHRRIGVARPLLCKTQSFLQLSLASAR